MASGVGFGSGQKGRFGSVNPGRVDWDYSGQFRYRTRMQGVRSVRVREIPLLYYRDHRRHGGLGGVVEAGTEGIQVIHIPTTSKHSQRERERLRGGGASRDRRQ